MAYSIANLPRIINQQAKIVRRAQKRRIASGAKFLYNSFAMKNERKRFLTKCALVFLAAAAYFFLSWLPLETEMRLTPEWTIDINKSPEKTANETPLPFRLGKKAGYFTHSGKITAFRSIPYKAVFTRNYCALYSRDAENIPLMSPDGQERCVIKGAGFPFIQQDRVFLFPPGGSAVCFVNPVDGNTVSSWENTAPITAFNSSKNGSAVGYADGQLIIFDKNGRKTIELFPGGSDNPIILGADISASGKMFACVSGVDPQRFVLYSDEGVYEKIVFHEFLKKNLTRQTYVHFSDNDKFVYYDCADSLGIVDTASFKKKRIPLLGTVLDIQESPVAESAFVLSRIGSNKYAVTILENWTHKTGEFSFEADAAFILTDGNTLYVGRDEKISRLTISKS